MLDFIHDIRERNAVISILKNHLGITPDDTLTTPGLWKIVEQFDYSFKGQDYIPDNMWNRLDPKIQSIKSIDELNGFIQRCKDYRFYKGFLLVNHPQFIRETEQKRKKLTKWHHIKNHNGVKH